MTGAHFLRTQFPDVLPLAGDESELSLSDARSVEVTQDGFTIRVMVDGRLIAVAAKNNIAQVFDFLDYCAQVY